MALCASLVRVLLLLVLCEAFVGNRQPNNRTLLSPINGAISSVSLLGISQKIRPSTSTLHSSTSTAPAPKSNESLSITRKMWKILQIAAPIAVSLVWGYNLGWRRALLRTTEDTAVPVVASSRPPVLLSVLLLLAFADKVWNSIPIWLKRQLPWVRRRYKVMEAASMEDDISNLTTLFGKLQSVFRIASEKMSSDKDLSLQNTQAAFGALWKLNTQLKGLDRETYRDSLYVKMTTNSDSLESPILEGVDETVVKDIVGRTNDEESVMQNDENVAVANITLIKPESLDTPRVLQGLDQAFEFADWAYDELPEGQTLKDVLQEEGFHLLKHDKTAVPGSVAHYIAISTTRKECWVGIKGTSGFEDFLTDLCGQAVAYPLKDGPFCREGPTEIYCHEGIVLAAQRLADDLSVLVKEFLLPSSYKIVLTGHSLGAGVASLTAILLRSRFPEFQKDDRVDSIRQRLRVLAFASPPVLDYRSAMACKAFATTIVNNADVICRASLSNALSTLRVAKTVEDKLEEKGIVPKNFSSWAAYIRMLTSVGDEMIMSEEEIRQAVNRVLEDMHSQQDSDALFVAGRVVHMYDLWSKVNGTSNDASKEEGVGTKGESQSEVPPSIRGVYIGDGGADVLRLIEMDPRMLSDHMAPAYRSSLRNLLCAKN